MAKKGRRRRRRAETKPLEEPRGRQEGWIGRRTGLWIISLLSLALGLFMGGAVTGTAGLNHG